MVADYRQQEITEQYLYAKSMDGFRAWLYNNYSIGNGHTLIALEEDGDIQEAYLSEMGLPLDTILEE